MRNCIKLLFALLGFFWLTNCFAYALPDLGDYSTTVFTSQEEQKIGKEFMQEVRNSLSLNTDPIINDYIQSLGQKLLNQTSAKKRHYHFFVVNDSNINAFSGPAGYVGINTGTIVATRSESELAAVMAHEIAHSTQHHIERLIQEQQGMVIPNAAAMAAAVLIGATASGNGAANIATGAATAMAAGTAQSSINYTREMEAEADNIGIKILYRAGFDPNAMSAFFSRMQRINYEYGHDVPAFLIDHPLTNKRIADSSGRAAQLIKPQTTTDPIYYFIRARTNCLESPSESRQSNFFKQQLNASKNTQNDALQYGYAIALFQKRQNSLATKIVAQLISNNPNLVILPMLQAQIDVANKKMNLALALLKNSLASNPYYYPLILQYAHTLINSGFTQEACSFLKNKAIRYTDDAEIYRLLADAQAKSGHKADAYVAKAQAYALDGYNRQAIILLGQALKLPNLSFNDKAIMQARISQLKQIELAARKS